MSERELFVAALHLTDLAARAAFLDQACAADPLLRDRVQSLLIEHDKMGSFLEAPAAPPADTDTPAFPPESPATGTFAPDSPPAPATADYPGRDEQAGAVVGWKYTLVEPIGEGGMGSVWRAKQTEPVKRFVALKLIKAGMDSKQVLARFEAERQALAMMDHPNIAKVLDGGVHDARPFFVMELVKGIPITDYCDERKLTPRQRLELFVPVCQAIQHAHQKGIIHRDIKPSNVLVALYDDRPVVKVIDFGVAKATGAALTEHTIDTGFGGVVGTPQYMSPEQATFNNLDIDTRSDVYALGVLLYELLTGSPPFSRKELEKKGLLEILRVVREEEPPRPSTKLSTADALPTLSANRGTEPKKLTGLLRNELDWIVMKALEKDRARRYETANGFAADVLRYLSGEAVQAHPPSASYRLKKFVRRNKGQVIAASLVLFALMAGITGTTVGLFEAKRQEKEAKKQEQIARDETAEKELARTAEAERVTERDAALKAEAERADELKHRLGVSAMVLANAAYDGRDYRLATERLDAVPAGQRGWEWRYMKRQLAGGIFTLRGHKGAVTSVAFSPDGTRIVTGAGHENEPFEAKVWDARTGTHLFDLKRLPVIAGGGAFVPVVCVAFSADGTRIVTAGGDTKARVWDAATGALRLELAEAEGEVKCAAFSPDGTRIATGCEEGKAGLVKVWDAQSGKPIRDWKAHKSDVRRLSFSQDGTRILTGGADHAVKVWDAQTGKNLLEAKGMMSAYSSVAFSPDATRIVAGREDGTARVIDSRTGEVLILLRGRPPVSHTATFPTRGVQSVAFSPDGTRIVTAGTGTGETSVWDARTGVELLELKGDTGFVMSASFSPDGERIITGGADSTVKVWDARTGTPRLELNGINSPIQSAAMSADGAWIVTGSGEPGREFANFGEATVWDARTGTVKHVLKGFKGRVNSVAISRDGTRIITGGGTFDNLPTGTDAGEVTVWDAATGKPLLDLKGLKEPVGCVSISPDGTRIVTAGYRGMDGFATGGGDELKVWEAKTGTLLLDLTQPDAPIRRPTQIGERGGSVAFSPDGKRFFTGGVWHKNGRVKVWDARTGQVLVEMKGLTFPVLGVAYSPDGTRVATAGYNKTATIWDAKTGTALVELKGHTSEVRCIAFSPDGKRIVTGGDTTIRVWDVRTGTTLAELKPYTGAVTSVSFSADGSQILTAGRGDPGKPAEVFLWNAPAHSQEVGLVGHTDWIEGVAFSPDGTRIATGSGDKTVKVWDTRTGAILLDLKGHKYAVRHVAFSADGSRILAGGNLPPAPALGGGDHGTVKVWDGRTGAEIVELKTGNHKIANFSTDGTRIVTEGFDEIRKVWDVKTGTELPGEPIPTTVLAERTSPDGRFFARLDGNRAEVIPMVPAEEELAYRRLYTQPSPSRYRSGYLATRAAKDEFAAAFYLNLVPPNERTALVAKADVEALASLSNRAQEHLGAGEPELAASLFVEILKVKKAKLGPEDPDTLETITQLAGLYWQMRQFDKSISLFEEILKVQEAKHGRDHLETIGAIVNVAVIYREAGRLKEAIVLLEEAQRAAKKYPQLGRGVTGELMGTYTRAGENAKAAILHLEMLPEVRKLLPKESPELADELATIGLALLRAKVFAEAEPLLRECLSIREKTLPDFWVTFNTQSLLGGVLLGQKKYADAEPLLVKGYEGMKAREKTIPPQGMTRLPEALDRLIELYTATNKPDEVKKYRDLRANYPTAKEVAPPPRERK